MEKKFLSKAVMYRCTELSWWNDGTERKPNKADFDNLQFDLLKNHNMKWVSLFNIELTIPREYEFNFFRLNYTTHLQSDPIIEYYYVEKVLDVNSRNKKMLLTLDIWCTYIISKLPVKDNQQLYNLKVQTNRWLPNNPYSASLSPVKKIFPYGYPTHSLKKDRVKWWDENRRFYSSGLWNHSDLEFEPSIEVFGYRATNKINLSGFYKYYVFTTEHTTQTAEIGWANRNSDILEQVPNGSKSIIIFPVLFDWCGELISRLPTSADRMGFTRSSTAYRSAWRLKPVSSNVAPITGKQVIYHLFNDEYNLIRLAERVKEHKTWTGLSKFLGVFYGDNYFKKTMVKIDDLVQGITFSSTENPKTRQRYQIKAGFGGRVYENFVCDNFLMINGAYDYTGKESIFSGFACARIGFEGLNLQSMGLKYAGDLAKQNTKNLYLLGDPDYMFNFGENKVYFTDRFSITNGFEQKELDSEVPLVLDDYYNTLIATKPQRDAALRTAIGNLATSAVKDWLPPAIHGQGVYAEKTAWGNYWNTQADYLGVKSQVDFMKELHPEDWVVDRKGSILKPWAKGENLLGAKKSQLLGQSLKQIGQSDLLMGKISRGLGIASSVGNVIGSTIQFANTLYGLKKQVEQIRLQTTSNLTSTSSAFLNKKYFFDKFTEFYEWDTSKTNQENNQKLYEIAMSDLVYGYEYIDKYNLSEYYGQEMLYNDININIGLLENGWINMSDGEMLFRKLYQWFKHILRNDIIEAIVKMLTQGVRVLPKP